MFSKLKIRKTAWILLLVALISLIPTRAFKVLANDIIVPPFPYDELQTIGDGNSYALFRVHGIDEVDYVEIIAPDANVHGMYQHLLPGLSYSGLGGWVLQINSIAYCFKNGQKVDFDLQSLFTSSFLPVDNDDPYFSCWLEFVYTTEDIYGINDDDNWATGYGLRFFKAQNFIIEPAATPTPDLNITPTPPLYGIPFDCPYSLTWHNPVSSSYIINNGAIIRVRDEANDTYEYYYILTGYNSSWTHQNWNLNFEYSLISDNTRDTLSLGTFLNQTSTTHRGWVGQLTSDTVINSAANFTGTSTNNFVFTSNNDFLVNFTILNSSGTYYIDGLNFLDDSIVSNPTPTPTTAPSPIPQPSVTPEPDDPDKNSSWGWGIVNTLKYIFIPDKNKLIRLEKTAQTKFQQFGGGYDDLKRVSGFEDPVRPQNVVMNWHPFSTDSEEQQPQQQITLVDFEQIDFYLFQTASGMFICDCLSASFTFLMFGYLIHVIRKHFVIENNTSEESDGGGD